MKKLKPKQRDYHIWIVTSRKMSVNWYCLSSSSSLAKLQSCLNVQQTSISPYLSFAPLFYWTQTQMIETQTSEKQNKNGIEMCFKFWKLSCQAPVNVITLGLWETDNINCVITFTKQTLWLAECKKSQTGFGDLRKMDRINQMMTFPMITWGGFHGSLIWFTLSLH